MQDTLPSSSDDSPPGLEEGEVERPKKPHSPRGGESTGLSTPSTLILADPVDLKDRQFFDPRGERVARQDGQGA